MKLKISSLLAVMVFALSVIFVSYEHAPVARSAVVSSSAQHGSVGLPDTGVVTTRAVSHAAHSIAEIQEVGYKARAVTTRLTSTSHRSFAVENTVYRRIDRGPPLADFAAMANATETGNGFGGVGYVHFARADI